VELPLTHPELYEDIGIRLPKELYHMGSQVIIFVLFMNAEFQAVSNSTSATFLHVFGSELIQKYLGDGPKLVRELFRVVDELSPSIVFIDKIKKLRSTSVLIPCCIGISPVYRAIFQPFHTLSEKIIQNNTIWY
ncbi:unnamed protein product, partial [Musa acuminata var. zebrina]